MMVFVLRLDRLREGRKIPKVGDALARVSDGLLGKEMFIRAVGEKMGGCIWYL